MIKLENGKLRYFDKNGAEITEGCKVKYDNGVRQRTVYEVYSTENDELGTDATSPIWIEKGWAYPCEHGIYTFDEDETDSIEVVKA